MGIHSPLYVGPFGWSVRSSHQVPINRLPIRDIQTSLTRVECRSAPHLECARTSRNRQTATRTGTAPITALFTGRFETRHVAL